MDNLLMDVSVVLIMNVDLGTVIVELVLQVVLQHSLHPIMMDAIAQLTQNVDQEYVVRILVVQVV